MRILPALLFTLIVGVLLYLIHMQLGTPPDPRLGGCDPQNITASATTELTLMSSWLLAREFMGALLTGCAAVALYYFQAFHALPVPSAWAARIAFLGAISLVCAAFVRALATAWVAGNPETCLAEALGTRSHEIGFSAQMLPLGWSWAVFADTIALTLLGALVGHIVYLIARRARA